jgi:hypothetical protein
LIDLVDGDRVEPCRIVVEGFVGHGDGRQRASRQFVHQRFTVKLGLDQLARVDPALHPNPRELGHHEQRAAQDHQREQALEQRKPATALRARLAAFSIASVLSHGRLVIYPSNR